MSKSEHIPIKDVIADADHPMHAEVKDMLGKLDRGEINMCACMGPIYGEPHCYCTMVNLGLPLSLQREIDNDKFNQRLNELFSSDGFCK